MWALPFLAADAHPRLAGVGVLGDVRERLGDDEIGSGLDGTGEPARALVDVDPDGDGGAQGESAHGVSEPIVGERRRMDPVRQLA